MQIINKDYDNKIIDDKNNKQWSNYNEFLSDFYSSSEAKYKHNDFSKKAQHSY